MLSNTLKPKQIPFCTLLRFQRFCRIRFFPHVDCKCRWRWLGDRSGSFSMIFLAESLEVAISDGTLAIKCNLASEASSEVNLFFLELRYARASTFQLGLLPPLRIFIYLWRLIICTNRENNGFRSIKRERRMCFINIDTI